MNAWTSISALLLAGFLAGTAQARVVHVTDAGAPRSLPAQGPVSVRWEDPAQFSELRYSHNRWEASRGDWVMQLATWLRTRAERRLPPGERLDIDITDIQRAGNYEPWLGIQFDSVRILRDLYPPRIRLTVQRLDANGRVVAEGERRLSDPGFLMNDSNFGRDDPLRFEKRMIDRWLVRELGPGKS
ncbi:MAG: DUF3016 domain-containing protein [Luteimonas sp.]